MDANHLLKSRAVYVPRWSLTAIMSNLHQALAEAIYLTSSKTILVVTCTKIVYNIIPRLYLLLRLEPCNDFGLWTETYINRTLLWDRDYFYVQRIPCAPIDESVNEEP